MGKYFAILSNGIKESLAYRVNSIIMMFSVFFSFSIMYFLWSSIYQQGNQIGDYTFNEIITYYIYVTIFELLFVNYAAWSIGEEIKDGHLNNIILKPIKYLEYKLAHYIGVLVYRLMLFTTFIAFSLYLLRNFIVFPNDSVIYLQFIFLAFASYILNFLIYYIVGICAFWFDDVYGFLFAWLVIVSFMQGQWIPLDLLPNWFNVLNSYLPFQYMFFVPISVVSQRLEFNSEIAITVIAWCFFLYLIANYIFKKGLKKYEGYGS